MLFTTRMTHKLIWPTYFLPRHHPCLWLGGQPLGMGLSCFWGAFRCFCHCLKFPAEEDIKSSISTSPLRTEPKGPSHPWKVTPLTLHHGVLPLGRVLLPRAQSRVRPPSQSITRAAFQLRASESISPGLGGCPAAPDHSSPWGISLTSFHEPLILFLL